MGDLIKFGIKVAAIASITVVFMVAITFIISFIVNITGTTIISEVLGVVSNCLPFDASSVFGGLYGIIVAILSFLTARKIWLLGMKSVDSTS